MGNDFDSICLKNMESEYDLELFYKEHLDCVKESVVKGEKYSVLSDGCGMELYFYGDSEKIWFNDCEPYYSPTNIAVKN